MALLDEIRKRLSGGGTQPPAPGASPAAQQQAIQQTLAAKTGKARAAEGPAASSVQAGTAAAAAATQAKQLDFAGAQAAATLGAAEAQQASGAALGRAQTAAQLDQGMKDIRAQQAQAGSELGAARSMFDIQSASKSKQELSAIEASAKQAVARLASDRGIEERDLWSSFAQGNQDLALRKDAAQLEQTAFTMALSDQAYLQNLQQVGMIRRLNDQGAFERDLNSMILDDETKAMLSQFDWERLNNADTREWEEAMSKINVDAALAIATSKAKVATASHYVSGAGELAQAGVKASKKKPPEDQETGNSQP